MSSHVSPVRVEPAWSRFLHDPVQGRFHRRRQSPTRPVHWKSFRLTTSDHCPTNPQGVRNPARRGQWDGAQGQRCTSLHSCEDRPHGRRCIAWPGLRPLPRRSRVAHGLGNMSSVVRKSCQTSGFPVYGLDGERLPAPVETALSGRQEAADTCQARTAKGVVSSCTALRSGPP